MIRPGQRADPERSGTHPVTVVTIANVSAHDVAVGSANVVSSITMGLGWKARLLRGAGMRKIMSRLWRAVLVIVSVVLMMLGLTNVASASGSSIVPFAEACWGDLCVPSGILEHHVNGRHRVIVSQWAEVEVAGAVCNWRIDFVFLDDTGKEYDRSPGRINNECVGAALREYAAQTGGKQYQYGRTCAEAFTNGEFIAKACVDIVQDRD
jgi:hypothetical protein